MNHTRLATQQLCSKIVLSQGQTEESSGSQRPRNHCLSPLRATLSLCVSTTLACGSTGSANMDASVSDAASHEATVRHDANVDSSQPRSGSCGWPVSLDVDAGTINSGTCSAYRWLLSCSRDGGGGATCPVDGDGASPPSSCPPPAPVGLTCLSECAVDEYVAFCQSFEAPAPQPGCHQLPSGPEQTYFCCPCLGLLDGG
jgi:hypothetical protein